MTALDIIIRKAQLADLAVLPQIEHKADGLFPDNQYPDDMGLCSLQELEHAMNQGFLWVAVNKGQLVGFSMAGLLGEYLHLQQLSVLPEFGRRGIGAGLLKVVAQQALAVKVVGVTLTTFSNIPWNAPYYEKQGFVVFEDAKLPACISRILEKETALGLKNRLVMYCPVAAC